MPPRETGVPRVSGVLPVAMVAEVPTAPPLSPAAPTQVGARTPFGATVEVSAVTAYWLPSGLVQSTSTWAAPSLAGLNAWPHSSRVVGPVLIWTALRVPPAGQVRVGRSVLSA